MTLKNIFLISTSLILIVSCLYSARLIVALFQLSLPAPLLGMLILFALLSLKVVKPDTISVAAKPILKYMALFFVPAGVGIMQYQTLFTEHGWLLLSILLVVPTIGLAVVGYIAKQGQYRV